MAVRIINGDCRTVLRTLPDESVHCVVTSPPYYGLRDYGTAKWEGGNNECDHVERQPSRGTSTLTSAGIGQTDDGAAYQAQKRQFRALCGKCGARRVDDQIGLEDTPDAYIAEMVAVFREVRRVLRSDGTLWLNIGDSYASGGRSTRDPGQSKLHPAFTGDHTAVTQWRPADPEGIKPKDLIGIPWMLAFALRADGWWLRQDIIWAKPNPMPESVTDRCTKAHEYLFLLTKSARYHYDAEAIAEAAERAGDIPGGNNSRGVGEFGVAPHAPFNGPVPETRNRRSVWTIATQPFKEAHFATFPPALVEPCIKAGCPAGGTVLDPFGGAGTVGLVADRLQRDAILIELNPAYADMARQRVTGDAPLLAVMEPIL